MFEDAVEGRGGFDSDEGMGVFRETDVDSFDCLFDDFDVQLHGTVLTEDVHCACS